MSIRQAYTPQLFQCITQISKEETTKLLQVESTAERSSNVKQTVINNPTNKCDQCTASFDTNAKLQTHKCKQHQQINQFRQLVTRPICPICGNNYKTIRNCQDHITKICGPRATRATVNILTDQLQVAQAANVEGSTVQNKRTSLPANVTFIPNIQALLSRTKRNPLAQVQQGSRLREDSKIRAHPK